LERESKKTEIEREKERKVERGRKGEEKKKER
jgi:hypothetical protein